MKIYKKYIKMSTEVPIKKMHVNMYQLIDITMLIKEKMEMELELEKLLFLIFNK